MALQQRAVREDLAAGRARRALWPVRAHVHVERALLRETLGTDSALESTHSRVCDHMLEQIVAQRERSPAHGALVGLLPCGRHGGPRTQGQGGRNPKCLCPASPPRPTINPESPAQQGHLLLSGTTPSLPHLTAQQGPSHMVCCVPSPPPSCDIPLQTLIIILVHRCQCPPPLTGNLPAGNLASVGRHCALELTTQVSPDVEGSPLTHSCHAQKAF